jgi:hypothetical protein
MENYIEELVAEFYKTKGYFVTTNFWIPFKTQRNQIQRGNAQNYEAQSWTDIDVLARNNKELILIQVKATIDQKITAHKINLYFERVEQFLTKGVAPDGKTKIEWWTKNIKLKKIVVYEDKYSPPSCKKILNDNGIETVFFGDYLADIITYIEQKVGVKEENAVMRLLHFLNRQKLLLPKKLKSIKEVD